MPAHAVNELSAMPADEIRRRLARWQRSSDPRDLWPDFTEPTFRAALHEISRATATLLQPGEPSSTLTLPPDVGLRAFGIAAFTSGMGPLLGYWIERGRLLGGSSDVRALLGEHLDHGRRRAARLHAELGRVVSAFQEHGIDPVVLKGCHTGITYFPDPGTRPLGDLDLLVGPEEFEAASHVLASAGYVVSNPGGLPYRCEWVRSGGPATPRSLEMTHVDNPFALDLHRTLDRAFFGHRPAGFGTPAGADIQHVELGGVATRVLRQPLLLAYLAFHTASHFLTASLVRLVELALVAGRDFRDADAWDALGALLATSRAGALLYPPLALTEQLVPGTLDGALLTNLARRAPRRMRRVVARTTPSTLQQLYARSWDARLMWPMSGREAVAVAADLLWPGFGVRPVSPRELARTYLRRLRKLLANPIKSPRRR